MSIDITLLFIAFGALWIATAADAQLSTAPRRRETDLPLHIFTMQKDESSLLLDWFNYHAKLTGEPRNIHIIDNNSTDPKTLRVLAFIRERGGEVISYKGKYAQSAKYTEAMRQHISEPAFLIPLDADEFLAGLKDRQIIIDPVQVREIFRELPVDGFRYKLRAVVGIPCNLDTRDDISIPLTRRATDFLIDSAMKQNVLKSFYYSRSFVSTGEGSHYGKVNVDEYCYPNNRLYSNDSRACQHSNIPLGSIHFGVAHSFFEFDRKMTRGARARGHNVSVDSSAMCPSSSLGVHYCLYIAEKNKYGIDHMKEKYEARFKELCSRPSVIHFPELGETLNAAHSIIP